MPRPPSLAKRRAARATKLAQQFAHVIPLRHSIHEAAAILRKSVAGVYIAVREGRLKLTKDGGRSYIARAELERYCAACEQREPQPQREPAQPSAAA